MCRIAINSLLELGGHLPGLDDVEVSATTAEVAAHGPTDLVFGGGASLVQERPHAHDLARRAEAALERVLLDEGPLHRIQLAVAPQPLDRGDLTPLTIDAEQQARVHGPSVHQHGARAAIAHVTDLLGPGQLEIVAQ